MGYKKWRGGGENYPLPGISEWEDLAGGSRFGLRGGKE